MRIALLIYGLVLLLLSGRSMAHGREIAVAADGSGEFKSVQAAVDSVSESSTERAVIHIKPGRYEEKIRIDAGKPPITFLGEHAEKTVLVWHNNAGTRDADGDRIGTFLSASVTINANDFRAQNITFENTTGKGGGQALAISVTGDRAAFKDCRFLGWQDTMYLERGRQYFDNCYIAGHVDFIFGGAMAFFDHCHVNARAGGYLTAASTPQEQPYGFVFRDCQITADAPDFKTVLGRPWRPFAATAFINCEFPANITPAGWNNWGDRSREKTARYAECNSTGPGAATDSRASWAQKLSDEEAAKFSVENVLSGVDQWNPRTGEHLTPATRPATQPSESLVYLMTSFRNKGEDGLHLAYSRDGYNWKEVPGSLLKPTVGTEKLVRDPSICQTPDGTFHLVWTTGWRDKGIGYATSKDLIHWSEQKFLEVMKSYPTAINVWAPEIRYEESRRNFMLYWSSTIPGKFAGDDEDPEHLNHRTYSCTTADFETFSKPNLVIEPGFSCIDGIVIDRPDTRFSLVFKDERQSMLRLRVAYGTVLYGAYDNVSEPITPPGSEGPTCLKIGDKWIVYYDKYRDGTYGAVQTSDLKHWTDISEKVTFPAGQRHGTAIAVPEGVLQGLLRENR